MVCSSQFIMLHRTLEPARWIPRLFWGVQGGDDHGLQTQTLLLSGRRSRHFLAKRAARTGL